MSLNLTLTTAEFFLCFYGLFFLLFTINLVMVLRKHYKKKQ